MANEDLFTTSGVIRLTSLASCMGTILGGVSGVLLSMDYEEHINKHDKSNLNYKLVWESAGVGASIGLIMPVICAAGLTIYYKCKTNKSKPVIIVNEETPLVPETSQSLVSRCCSSLFSKPKESESTTAPKSRCCPC